MNKPRILIDMDSVLYDLMTPWLKLYNRDYPQANLTKSQIYTWDMKDVVVSECGSNIYNYLRDTSEIYVEGNAIEHSIEVTKHWSVLNYDLAVLTACVGHASFMWKAAWLDTYFPHIKNKILMQGNHIKHWVQADIMIDDAPHNLEHFLGFKILMNEPWNQAYNEPDVLRVNNWLAIERAVDLFIHHANEDYAFDEYCGLGYQDIIALILEDDLFNELNTSDDLSI